MREHENTSFVIDGNAVYEMDEDCVSRGLNKNQSTDVGQENEDFYRKQTDKRRSQSSFFWG